jgi:DNA invertase Pin-like site-specific DNA recombinase
MDSTTSNSAHYKHSIWLGYQRPIINGSLVWRPGHDSRLREIVEGQGRPLLLVARNSNDGGRTGCRATAEDAHEAIKSLAERAGMDATHLLPSREDLAEWLFTSQNRRKFVQRSGKTFGLRSCLVDMTEHGLLLCLSAGSAVKLDANHEQPHVMWVKRVIREVEPPVAGLYVKRFDRLSRSTSDAVILELRELEERQGSSWSGNALTGWWDIRNNMAEVMNSVNGVSARLEAEIIRDKSMRGVASKTDEVMVDGRVRFAAASALPPGLFRYRDRRSREFMLALDSPQFYPAPGEAISGVPEVRDAEGNRVDQVANVQWILANFGVDDRGELELLEQLVARRYSSQTLRSRSDQGPTAFWGGPSAPLYHRWRQRWFDVFERNLDLYKTGLLVRHIDEDHNHQVVVEGVLPPSGQWAREEDFERIEDFLARRRAITRPRPRHRSWTGVEATFDGMPARLDVSSSRSELSGSLWVVTTSKVAPRRPPARAVAQSASAPVSQPDPALEPNPFVRPHALPHDHRTVPDRILTAAIIAAVVAANGQPLRRFVTADVVVSDLAALTARRDRLKAEIDARERVLDLQLSQVIAVDGSGVAMPDAMRDAAYRKWTQERLAVDRLSQELATLAQQLSSFRSTDRGVTVQALEALVNALRTSQTSPYRETLRKAIRNLRFTSEPVMDGTSRGTRIAFEGELVVSTSSGPRSVPFAGSHLHGRAATAHDDRLQALADLRAGRIARFASAPGRTNTVVSEVGALLGLEPRQFQLGICGDSDLLRLGMAVMYPDPVEGEDPASVPAFEDLLVDPDLVAQFGDVEALASAIRAHYTRFRAPRWLRREASRVEVDALIASASGDSTPHAAVSRATSDRFRNALRANARTSAWEPFRFPNRPVVIPCGFCGGRWLAPFRVPEMSGYVCLAPDCRRDSAGVRWPTRFDHFISWPNLWVSAGCSLSLPDDFTFDPKLLRAAAANGEHPGRSPRVPPEAQEHLLAAYASPDRTVSDIVREFNVSKDAFYAVVRDAGVAYRRRDANERDSA